MSEHSETITEAQIKPVDKIRLTNEDADGTSHTLTGTVRAGHAERAVIGSVGYSISGRVHSDTKIERLTPDWTEALVVQAGGRTFGKIESGDTLPWVELASTIGAYPWHSDDSIAAAAGNGEPRIIVAADGSVAA